uniref:BtpA family membrane complex biogenesis protein n=1 Tax=Glossina brevipalpis TaxID=37001 RepID=A0A1A9WEL1_9MUSC
MHRFLQVFHKQSCNIIGMVHIGALPGTPLYKSNWLEIIEKAKYETEIYKKYKLDSVLIENMHDVPYTQDHDMGPETVACMSKVAQEIRNIMPASKPVGIQILASANEQALAVAKACNLQYIRAEGFVFGHIADEGYTNACAGRLLRYRRHIDASRILIFTDLKKKHSSHAVTNDISLLETAKAAQFFLSDGVIVTGLSTGQAAKLEDILSLRGRIDIPLIVGSGVTGNNLKDYFYNLQAAIIGSYFKQDGHWANDLCEETIENFMHNAYDLTPKNCLQI